MSVPVPRFLLPRGYILSYSQLARPVISSHVGRHTLPLSRNASASTSKPRVLEKPTKFNPPSHGKRLKRQMPRQYGPYLTMDEKVEQETKQYPHMMPPEGSWMYWFLTNRRIHIYISLGVLVFLAVITAIENWRVTTAFREQMPAAADFLFQPLTAIWRVVEVWKMDTEETSVRTAEKRRKNVEDVQKRTTYRIAHGLEDENSQGLGGWTAKSDEEALGPGAKTHRVIGRPVGVEPGQELEVESVPRKVDRGDSIRRDLDGRRPVKKWFGIW